MSTLYLDEEGWEGNRQEKVGHTKDGTHTNRDTKRNQSARRKQTSNTPGTSRTRPSLQRIRNSEITQDHKTRQLDRKENSGPEVIVFWFWVEFGGQTRVWVDGAIVGGWRHGLSLRRVVVLLLLRRSGLETPLGLLLEGHVLGLWLCAIIGLLLRLRRVVACIWWRVVGHGWVVLSTWRWE